MQDKEDVGSTGSRLGRALAALASVAILLGSLAGLPPTVAAADPLTPPVPEAFRVEITPTGFEPSTIDLVVGQSVVFTNASGAPRRIEGQDSIFDSGDVPVGGAFTVAIPDERAVPFSIQGTAFAGTLRVGPNGFDGPGDDPISAHLPTASAPPEDDASFAVDPRWGLVASRTTILLTFRPAATVADGNRLLTAIHGRVAGIITGTPILVVNIPDRVDGSFDDLTAALAVLRADPVVNAAALDTVGEEHNAGPLGSPPPDAAVAAGFSLPPYPLPAGSPTGGFGLVQARFPQAWNLLERLRQRLSDVQVGVIDTGFDLDHGEFADVPGRGKHITFSPTCFGPTACVANTTGPTNQGHGTGAAGQVAGVNVGGNPLADLVVTVARPTKGTGLTGGATVLHSFAAIAGLLDQKTPTGRAPNLAAINMSYGDVAFVDVAGTWATAWKGRLCGPLDGDDPAGVLPCTPNTEDGYRREMANLGATAAVIARKADDKDVVLVQSAGNDSSRTGNRFFCVPFASPSCTTEAIRAEAMTAFGWVATHTPAATNNVLSVGALDKNGRRSSYSNIGADVSAGGSGDTGGTVTASPGGGYQSFGGTSGAAPYVSALVSLVAQYDPTLRPAAIRALIISRANADTTDLAAPRIDAYATLTALPGALIDALDVNDASLDGNRRVVQAAGSLQGLEDLALGVTADGVQLHAAPDGVLDMRDFRRYRDAWLQGCAAATTAGCPTPISVVLDGSATHPKKDLNLDGCVVTCPPASTPPKPARPESTYPRLDPAGSGGLERQGLGIIGVEVDGSAAAHSVEAGNLQVMSGMFGKAQPGALGADLEGWTGADLPDLMTSGDLEVHVDSMFDLGITDVLVTPEQSADGGRTWRPLGRSRTVTAASTRDEAAIFTVPIAATPAGTMLRVGLTGTLGGKVVHSTRPRGTLHVGQDARIDPKVISGTLAVSPKVLAKGGTGKATVTLLANGKRVKKKTAGTHRVGGKTEPGAAAAGAGDPAAATSAEPAVFEDGTDDLIDAPVEFTAEGTGTNPADPEVTRADTTTDDAGEASADLAAGPQGGAAEITATATVADAPVTVVLDTKVTGAPTRLVYSWEQRITDWHRHNKGQVEFDPANPDETYGRYDYDEGPPEGSGPVVMKRTGSIDLSAPTPVLDETVNDATYRIHSTSAFYGDYTSTHSIYPNRRRVANYWLDQLRFDTDEQGMTLRGLDQVSAINYAYDCDDERSCATESLTRSLDSWLAIGPRKSQLIIDGKWPGGTGTSFQHAPDPVADLRIRRDSSGNWLPMSYCGSSDEDFPVFDFAYLQTGTLHQETRFTATIVDAGGDPVLTLPDCSNPAPPVARFSTTEEPGRSGVPTTFVDDSTAASGIQSWAWDFGDRTTSTDASPDHLYGDPGTYTAKLTITDGTGRTSSATHTITVNPNPPTGSIDDQAASADADVILHGRISSPSDFDRRSLRVDLSSSAPGFPIQAQRRLPAGPIDVDLGRLAPGSYPITMVVTDLAGQTTTATATIVVVPGTPPPVTDPPPVDVPADGVCTEGFTVPGEADQLVVGLSELRERARRLEVLASPTLQVAAQRHAADLATHPELVDVGSDGSTVATRAADAKYPDTYSVDELVLRGPKLAADALAAWQNDAAKGGKLLDRQWVGVGAARVQAGSGWVWVLVLGEIADCPQPADGNVAALKAPAPAAKASPVPVRTADDLAAVASSLPARTTPVALPAPERAKAETKTRTTTKAETTTRTASAGTAASDAPKAEAKEPGATTAVLADLPDEAVPAFTIDVADPTTGVPVVVHNRSRLKSTPVNGRFSPGDGRPAVLIQAEASTTTMWFSAGTPRPSIRTRAGDDATIASSPLAVTGGTLTPAVTYTGPTSAAQGATVAVSATVVRSGTTQPVAGRAVTFAVGLSTATGTTGGDGKVTADLVLAPTTPAGATTLTVSAGAVGASPAASASSPFTVGVNAPPVADAGGPYVQVLGEKVLLDGSDSSDPDGSPSLTYAWDLGDQGTFEASGDFQPSLTFGPIEQQLCGGTCAADVAYPIALRVTDDLGASAEDHTTITFRRDFFLTIDPPATTLNPGGTASYQVGIVSASGFDTPVNLSVGPLPAGVTASIPETAQAGTTVILSVTAAQAVTAEEIDIVVTGTAKGLSRQVGGAVDLEFGLIPTCTGSLEGRVTDRETGEPVAGAYVFRDFTQVATTGADGTYRADGLAVGRTNQPVGAQLTFSKPDYWGEGKSTIIACNLTARSSGTVLKKQTATLTGRVTIGTRDDGDPTSPVVSTGVPLPGATVSTSYGSKVADQDGRYTVADIPLNNGNAPGSTDLVATFPGYWRSSTPSSMGLTAAGPNVADFTLLPACYGDLYVKVIDDTTGAVVAGAPVNVPTSGPFGDTAPRAAVTGPDGIVHIERVPLSADNRPAAGLATASPPLGSTLRSGTPGSFNIPRCGSTALAIAHLVGTPPVYSGGIRVRVVDDATGSVVPNAVVGLGNLRQTTDGNGDVEFLDISFGLPGVGSMGVDISTTPPGYYREFQRVSLLKDQTVEAELRVHRQLPATVTGTITDALTGRPISGMRFNLSVAGGANPLTSDAQGRYSYTGTFLDPYNEPTKGFASTSGDSIYWGTEQARDVTFTVAGPNVADLKLVRKCAPGTIHGVVRNALTREPIAGVNVSSQLGNPGVTDAQGRFTMTQQQYLFDKPGPLDVKAVKAGFVTSTKRVNIFCGADIELNFGETPATTSITGTVIRRSDSTPVADLFVGTGYGGTATTNALGTYTLTDVPLGDDGVPRDWKVTALPTAATGLVAQAKTAHVTSAGPTTLDFQLEAPEAPAGPDAADDAYDVDATADRAITSATGVLANDTGQALKAAIGATPAHGTVHLDADGGFTYEPSGGFLGDVTFTYTATDAAGATDTATVTLHVLGPPPPKANDDTITVAKGSSVEVTDPAGGLLANDVGTATLTAHTAVDHGQFVVHADGTYTYASPAPYFGTFTSQYTITDAFGRTSTATITFHVTDDAPPPAPVAGADVGSTPYQTPLVVAAPGVLTNDTGTGISVTASTQPGHGTVVVNTNGSYTYTPANGFSGDDSFTYTITDAIQRSASATVKVTVGAKPTPAAPVANPDSGSTPYQTARVVAAPGVLTNDTGTGITVTGSTQPAHGSVSIAANGSYTYTPDDGFSDGVDSFTYTITDELQRSATATVTITVGAKPTEVRASVGDRVFRDLDADGLQDQGEVGVAGVAVQLLDGSGAAVASTTTDADGVYAFADLAPGSHGVRFTAPLGFAFSPAGAGTDRQVDSDPDLAGLVAPFALTADDDSIDAGLVPLPAGLAITQTALPVGSTGPATAVAQAPRGSAFQVHVAVVNTGQAPLTGVTVTETVVPGCARVIGTLEAGASTAYDCDGTVTPSKDTVGTVHVVGTSGDGPVAAGASVTLQLTYSIGDRVWEDQDHDGIQDAGEPGIAGVAVALLDAGGAAMATTAAGADGGYRFDGLRPGSYRVRTSRSGAYRWTVADAGTDDTADADAIADTPASTTATSPAVAIADGQAPAGAPNPLGLTDASIDAGLWRPSSIAGAAYADVDHDGARGRTEAGIAGLAVDLVGAGEDVVATTRTGANGAYAFADLVPGTYQVRWVVPDGYELPTAPAGGRRAAPATDGTGPIELAVAQARTGVDLALWPSQVVPPTTTTTTLPPTTTTTTDPPSTTTSTPGGTTSTTPGTTTSTPPGATTTTRPEGTAPAGASPPEVGDGALSRTGQDTFGMVGLGLALVTTGGVVLALRRRRLSAR